MLSYSVECLHFLHGITGRVWWRRRRKEDHEFEASLGSTELWSLGSDFFWGCCLWTTGESETLSEGCLGAKGEWEKTKDSPETTWVSWLPSPLGADLYLQQKVLNFNEIQFVCIFSFVISKKPWSNPRAQRFIPMFPFKFCSFSCYI